MSMLSATGVELSVDRTKKCLCVCVCANLHIRTYLFIYLYICQLYIYLELHPQNMEVPRLGVESELQPPAYATATATLDPSCVCDLHHSSWQCRILNPHPHGSIIKFSTAEPQRELHTSVNISICSHM